MAAILQHWNLTLTCAGCLSQEQSSSCRLLCMLQGSRRGSQELSPSENSIRADLRRSARINTPKR